MNINEYVNMKVADKNGRTGFVIDCEKTGDDEGMIKVIWDDSQGIAVFEHVDNVTVDYKGSFRLLRIRAEELAKKEVEVKAEAQIMRECLSSLRDLCVASGFQVVPHLQAYEPIKMMTSDVEALNNEIKRRLEMIYNRPKIWRENDVNSD